MVGRILVRKVEHGVPAVGISHFLQGGQRFNIEICECVEGRIFLHVGSIEHDSHVQQYGSDYGYEDIAKGESLQIRGVCSEAVSLFLT